MRRKSGILLPVFSLPGPGGIGTLGPEAYRFADFLHASGMQIWQVLPMGPTGYGESPYQSTSTFAGNPLLISLEQLRQDGLLQYEDRELDIGGDPSNIDYTAVSALHDQLLRRCFQASFHSLELAIRDFQQKQPWVDDFALFTAIKKHFHQVSWQQWPDQDLRLRVPKALDKYRALLKEEISFVIFCQYLFFQQWQSLHDYCKKLKIALFGDMPIYVAEDSCDTWTHPKVFQLDKNRVPTRVAGVPPDYFSEDGQLWGNPLYNWHYLRWTGFAWWIDRMRHMGEMYDIVRIDHFIGLANYYSIPYGSKNARVGQWIKAPGKAFLKKLKKAMPDLEIIAEDLGCVNKRVQKLIDWSGYPGMRVLVFGFDGDDNVHHPSQWVSHCVAYTGTHDNDTVLGYLKRADENAIEKARNATGFQSMEDGPEAFVKTALASIADTVIIPMQDLLGLDNTARMNIPSTIGGNWQWRMQSGDLSDALSQKLLTWNQSSGRKSS